jgi:hypothetical protein
VGKGALFAPCPRGHDDGGHASLCPPYKSDGIDMIRTSETMYWCYDFDGSSRLTVMSRESGASSNPCHR